MTESCCTSCSYQIKYHKRMRLQTWWFIHSNNLANTVVWRLKGDFLCVAVVGALTDRLRSCARQTVFTPSSPLTGSPLHPGLCEAERRWCKSLPDGEGCRWIQQTGRPGCKSGRGFPLHLLTWPPEDSTSFFTVERISHCGAEALSYCEDANKLPTKF